MIAPEGAPRVSPDALVRRSATSGSTITPVESRPGVEARPGVEGSPGGPTTIWPPLRRLPLPVCEPFPAHGWRPKDVPAGNQQPLLPLGDLHADTRDPVPTSAVPAGAGGPRAGSARARPHPGPPAEAPEQPAGRCARPGPADPQAWARQFLHAALEAVAGIRPPAQLVRWTTTEVQAQLTRRSALTERLRATGPPSRGNPRVLTLRVCEPAAGVCEVGAVVTDPPRVRAVALRLETVQGRWRATALELG